MNEKENTMAECCAAATLYRDKCFWLKEQVFLAEEREKFTMELSDGYEKELKAAQEREAKLQAEIEQSRDLRARLDYAERTREGVKADNAKLQAEIEQLGESLNRVHNENARLVKIGGERIGELQTDNAKLRGVVEQLEKGIRSALYGIGGNDEDNRIAESILRKALADSADVLDVPAQGREGV